MMNVSYSGGVKVGFTEFEEDLRLGTEGASGLDCFEESAARTLSSLSLSSSLCSDASSGTEFIVGRGAIASKGASSGEGIISVNDMESPLMGPFPSIFAIGSLIQLYVGYASDSCMAVSHTSFSRWQGAASSNSCPLHVRRNEHGSQAK